MSGCGRRGMDAGALRRPLPDAAALKIVMRGGADKTRPRGMKPSKRYEATIGSA
jgi:hypothetical protein